MRQLVQNQLAAKKLLNAADYLLIVSYLKISSSTVMRPLAAYTVCMQSFLLKAV